MAIKLVTGQPRNGKSMRMIKELYKIQKENDKLEEQGKPRRKVYTDISGINADDVEIHFLDCVTNLTREQKETIWFGEHDDPNIPSNFWCPPYDSIFMFDECHKLDFVKDVSGTLSKNKSTISLNEHGHAGHIIYLITQFPQYVHTHIRGLLEQHWHVKKKFNLPMARVYKWDDFILNPRAGKNLKDAHSTELLFFLKKYKNAYKSAKSHEKQPFQFPAKLILPLVILFVIGVFLLQRSDDSVLLGGADSEPTAEQQQTQKQIDDMKSQNQQQLEQINQMRFELEELKQKYLPKHIATLAAYEDVRPAMVISNENGGCVAYNTYGEPLLLTDSLCYEMNQNPALIPKSRQGTEVNSTLPEAYQPIRINPFSNDTDGKIQVDTFESPRPYS